MSLFSFAGRAGRWARALVIIGGLLVASPSGAGFVATLSVHRGGGGIKAPAASAFLGANVTVGHNGSTSHQSAVEGFESLMGRPMGMERVYLKLDDPFPGAYDYWSRDQGRVPLASMSASLGEGGIAKWRDIANGQYDAMLDLRATQLKAFGWRVFFIFHHEPENDDEFGTPADFIAAWKHIHDRFAADGVTNVKWVVTLMAYTFRIGEADLWYPGDEYVDGIAADGYNWYSCPGRTDPWTSFANVFGAFHDYGQAHGKKMIIAEFASMEDPDIPGRKATWITDAAATLKTWSDVKAATWYDNGPPNAQCTWWVDTSTSSLAAFQAMAADPYFGRMAPPFRRTGVTGYVGVMDGNFGGVIGALDQGSSLSWVFAGPSDHTVTDSSGMGLFDSGSMEAGASWTYKFIAAGNFAYTCTLHPGMTQTIKVPLVITPLSGGTKTNFTATWAVAPPPPGFVYNIQIQRPGSSSWSTWKSNQTDLSATFVPDSGTGTYSFRAQTKNSTNLKGSGWSKVISITVS